MKDWFMAHSRREQHVLLFISALVIITLVWFALLTPLNNLTEKMRRNNQQVQQSLTWMKQESIKRGVLPGINRAQPIDVIINASAKKYGVNIQNLSLEDHVARVSVSDMALSDFLNWLLFLKGTWGITANQLEFSSSANQEGYIQITALMLIRK
ncbi:hypothetical protein CYR55_21610 [Chimaeribacter californicus]|uniref:Type II secretion system protein M n=1 Tax=Chimaeribacter californicus TaxID=2060067 RepID=A0A2N5DVE4_9GAMM|nr:type II secretion system protein GspM [Chimaeribacter californicus]PLR30999.1 hypothetical protein CYR55_21610 [Chimaeribacter californicus]